MEYTRENCYEVAQAIAEAMELEDLIQYVTDDLFYTMRGDKDVFDHNVNDLGW